MKALIFSVAFLFSCSQAIAATLTVGTPNGRIGVPFRPPVNDSTARYQQVWDAAIFSNLGPIEIQAFSFGVFFGDVYFPTNAPQATYDFSFSTTSRAVNELDTSRTNSGFQSNLGTDNTFFNQTIYNNERLTENPRHAGSFLYDQSQGNLLLDVEVTDIGPSGGFNVGAAIDSGGLFSQSFSWGRFGAGENQGAVVTFDYEPIAAVPLPASMLFLLAGIGSLGLFRRRRAIA